MFVQQRGSYGYQKKIIELVGIFLCLVTLIIYIWLPQIRF